MFNYCKGKLDLDELINELRKYEAMERSKREDATPMQGFWFNFGKSDTLATTIPDIQRNLMLPVSHPNHKLMLEQMKDVFRLDEELQVFFS